jgi:FAD:protein FMN transferase
MNFLSSAMVYAALAGAFLTPSFALADSPWVEAPDPSTGDHLIDRSRTTMGTLLHITVWSNDDGNAVQAIQAAFDEFERLDHLMTTWTNTSDVSRINAAAGDGKPIKVDPEVLECVARGIEGSRMSGGAFDLTVGSFSGVWKFDEDNDGSIPDPALVAQRKKLVDWRDIVLDKAAGTVRLKKPGQKITLGGIAKGYAVDRAVALMRARGLVDFIVQAGGDMYVSGRHGDRQWRVGIRDPRAGRDQFFAAAEVENHTFSTSGDYERFTIKDGKRYHHILDPRTGYPATGARSVTIMAKDAITAEVLSKVLFIWGPERGMKLIDTLPDVAAVIVGTDNKVTISKGLQGKLHIVKPPTDGV